MIGGKKRCHKATRAVLTYRVFATDPWRRWQQAAQSLCLGPLAPNDPCSNTLSYRKRWREAQVLNGISNRHDGQLNRQWGGHGRTRPKSRPVDDLTNIFRFLLPTDIIREAFVEKKNVKKAVQNFCSLSSSRTTFLLDSVVAPPCGILMQRNSETNFISQWKRA